MKNLLKTHENLVIFPLKYSQDFNGFWFPSESNQAAQQPLSLLSGAVICGGHISVAINTLKQSPT